MVSEASYKIISQVFSYLSIGTWLCAQLPQVYESQKNRKVEGLSPGFLIIWLMGDLSAFGGCILTGQMGFQTFLAGYYVMMDTVLTLQYIMFKQPNEPVLMMGIDPNDCYLDNMNNRRDKKGFRRRLSSIMSMSAIAATFGRGSALPLTATVESNTPINGGLLAYMLQEMNWSLGFLLSYFSSAMYVSSRVPQIVHNYKRKSTEGTTPLLFSATFFGNLTYTMSILTSPLGHGTDGHAFLKKELPFIIGTAGTMFFDIVLLFQFFHYNPSTRTTAPSVSVSSASSTNDAARLRACVGRRPGDKSSLLLSHQHIYSTIDS